MRLIDADALRADFHEPNNWLDPEQVLVHITGIWAEIDTAPTIDPVKHGRWMIEDKPKTGWYRITCSECGDEFTSTAPCIGFLPNAKVNWDYCPNCGARMDEVGE